MRFDLVRRRTVANRHFGWIPRVRVEHAGGVLTVGGELRAHDGRHQGEVVTGDGLPPGTAPGHAYYDYHPRTLSGSLFVREEWQPDPRLLLTADLAWRHQAYRMRGRSLRRRPLRPGLRLRAAAPGRDLHARRPD